MTLYIGLMSGTSMDGIDAALLEIEPPPARMRLCAGGEPAEVLICGGGAFNTDLVRRLERALRRARLSTTARYGAAPEHVEAAGFAWLAHCYLAGLPGNIPTVTGARHPAPLGALYRGASS